MEAVEFRDIRYILAVAREGSVSRAAERVFLTQPALSRILRRAETSLGVTLFDRSAFPLKVTPEGEKVLEYFRRMLSVEEELEAWCEARKNGHRSELTIGAPSYFCYYVLPPVIEQFRQEHPEHTIRLIEVNDNELRELLKSGAVNLGISVGDSMPPDLPSEVLAEETLVLAVPAAYPVNEALRGSVLSASEMQEGRYLDPDCPAVSMAAFRSERFLFLKEGNDIYRRGMKICSDAGFTPDILMYLDQMLSAYHLSAAGHGVTFVRGSIPHYVGGDGRLCFYRIDHPELKREIRVFTRQKQDQGQAEEFRAFLKESMPKL